MDKDKLSPKEQAFLAAARRETAARPAAAAPESQPKVETAASRAERLADLMAEERAQTLERKRKMRRYGLTIAGAILALFALWLFRVTRSRR